MRAAIRVVVLVALCACSDPVMSSGEVRDFRAAVARWQASNMASYSFETRIECFCDPLAYEWTRVTVTNGAVSEVRSIERDSVISPAFGIWAPIDTLFARLAQTSNAHGYIYRDVEVDFDPVLGYPAYVKWVSRPNVADAGLVYYLRNVRRLP